MRISKILSMLILVLFLAIQAKAQSSGENSDYRLMDQPFTIEFYYKIKWGHFDEFYTLYKKNHWPIIASGIKDGSILNATVHRPYNHSGEQDRWDLRVTVKYKNALIAHGLDDFELEKELNRLFPDREIYQKEEKRRFELLEEHMDVEVYEVSTGDWN